MNKTNSIFDKLDKFFKNKTEYDNKWMEQINDEYLFDNYDRTQIKELFEMFFNQPANESQIKKIHHQNYSPAHITSVFLRYRNKSNEALLHLDDIETKIVITPLIENN